MSCAPSLQADVKNSTQNVILSLFSAGQIWEIVSAPPEMKSIATKNTITIAHLARFESRVVPRGFAVEQRVL
jgi:hypothetical protein